MGRIRKPKYVEGFTDRLGRPRYYLRRPGFKRVPLSGLLWSAKFMDCYHALMGDDDAPARIRPGAGRIKSGSLHAALTGSIMPALPSPSNSRQRANARAVACWESLPRARRAQHGATRRAGSLRP